MTHILTASIEAYTWRGSMFITAGVVLQVVVLGALMRTPKTWQDIQQKHTRGQTPGCNQIFNIYQRPELVMFLLHYSIMACGISAIYVHITAATENFTNVSKQQAAVPLSLIGLSQIFGRVASGVIGQSRYVDTFLFYCLATFLSGLIIMLVPVVTNYTFIVGCSFVFGLLLSPYGSLYQIMLLYFCDLSDLFDAFAQMTLLSAVGYTAGAPLAGMFSLKLTFIF
jgi:predicted MFS family arabinose efflux permease